MDKHIYEFHEQMTKGMFAAWTHTDIRYLSLALCGEAGELANFVKKQWRDGKDYTEEIKEEICDIRVYLELLAKCFGIEGEKLDEEVYKKLVKVRERHKDRINNT